MQLPNQANHVARLIHDHSKQPQNIAPKNAHIGCVERGKRREPALEKPGSPVVVEQLQLSLDDNRNRSAAAADKSI
jgi:hypothetical protein